MIFTEAARILGSLATMISNGDKNSIPSGEEIRNALSDQRLGAQTYELDVTLPGSSIKQVDEVDENLQSESLFQHEFLINLQDAYNNGSENPLALLQEKLLSLPEGQRLTVSITLISPGRPAEAATMFLTKDSDIHNALLVQLRNNNRYRLNNINFNTSDNTGLPFVTTFTEKDGDGEIVHFTPVFMDVRFQDTPLSLHLSLGENRDSILTNPTVLPDISTWSADDRIAFFTEHSVDELEADPRYSDLLNLDYLSDEFLQEMQIIIDEGNELKEDGLTIPFSQGDSYVQFVYENAIYVLSLSPYNPELYLRTNELTGDVRVGTIEGINIVLQTWNTKNMNFDEGNGVIEDIYLRYVERAHLLGTPQLLSLNDLNYRFQINIGNGFVSISPK